mgnify:CR=1 FL=1
MFAFGSTGYVGGGGAEMEVTASSSTPAYGASVTITAAVTGFSPTSYTFTYPSDSLGNMTSTTQAGNSLAITAKGYGTQKVSVTATDSVSTTGGTVSLAVADQTHVASYISNIGTLTATQQTVARVLGNSVPELGFTLNCMYPFLGASATNTKRNLLGSSYEMTWGSGSTNNANGVTGNGTTADGDTGLNNNALGQNSVFIAFYSRTDGASGIDVFGATSPRTQLAARWSSTGQSIADINNSSTSNGLTFPADCRGFWAAWRDNSGYVKFYHRGPSWEKGYYWNTASTGLGSGNFKLSAGAVGAATNRNYSFLTIGAAAPNMEAVMKLERIVNAQMTALGLNVY